MLSTSKAGELTSSTMHPLLVLVGTDSDALAEVRTQLEGQPWRVETLTGLTELMALLRYQKPAVVVVSGSLGLNASAMADFGKTLKGLGVHWIQIIEFEPGLEDISGLFDGADDWVYQDRVSQELTPRIARLARRGATSAQTSKSTPDLRLVPLIVHDLRTPLNVIGLSLPMIEPALPKDHEEVQESYRFVEENFKQIERMLALLSDYNRLFEIDAPGAPQEFSPKRLLSEVVENRGMSRNGRPLRIDLQVDDSCPAVVALDQVRARQAFHYVLANAVAASPTSRVQVYTHGREDRWTIEFRISDPAPSSVSPVTLQPRAFERLCGTAGERRGMDLAVAARISELFGGSARLEADLERGTNVILEWPTHAEVA